MPSWEKKNTPEARILLVVRLVPDLRLESVNGCICGGTLGVNATMVSSALTLSPTLELRRDVQT